MKEHRSFFWPLTFIGTGVIWLLISMGRVPSENLWALTHIWPYLLIALGVGLILRSFWKPFGLTVSALVVLGTMAAIIYAPQFGWNDVPSWGDWGDLGDWNTGNDFSGAIPGSGRMDTENRTVDDFDTISIRYPGQYFVKQGEKFAVTVEAEDNLLPQLTTEVQNGTLVIENDEDSYSKRVRPTEDVKITITVVDLEEINFSSAGTLEVEALQTDSLELKLSGAGDATIKGLDVKSFTATVSGAGKITADGKTEEMTVTISGLGDFNGAQLQSQTAEVQISGAGTATLRVEENLTARISGAGTVNYYGTPEVQQVISGAGSVNRLDD